MMTLLKELLIRYHYRFLLLIILTLASGIFDSLGFVMLFPIFDALHAQTISHPENPLILYLSQTLFHTTQLSINQALLLIALVMIIAAIITTSATRLGAKIGAQFTTDLRTSLYQSILNANWTFLRNHNKGSFSEILTTEVNRSSTFLSFSLQLITASIMASVYTVLSLLVAWQAALFTIGIFSISILLYRRYHQHAYLQGKNTQQHQQSLHKFLYDCLLGLKITKMYGAEKSNAAKFNATTEKIGQLSYAFSLLQAKSTAMNTATSVALLILLFYLGLNWLHLSLAQLMVLMVIFFRLLPKLLVILKNYQIGKNLMPSLEAILNLRNSAKAAAEPKSEALPEATVFEHALSYQKLSYQVQGNQILDNVSFTLPKNSFTAIIGASGSGKTTLIDIMSGLMLPTTGQWFIDQQAMSEPFLQAWRQHVGLVTQDNILFEETILENLRFGNPNVTEAQAWSALKLACLEPLVKQLPQQLHTCLGEEARQLSGGEKQRLALARAFLKKPQLLLLDEGLSHLDQANAKRVMENLLSMKTSTTIVLVTHSPQEAAFADQVIRLDKGKVVEVLRQ